MKYIIHLIVLIAIFNSCYTNEDPVYVSLPDSLKFNFNTGDTFTYVSNHQSENKFIITVTRKHIVDPTRTYDYEYERVDFEKIDSCDTCIALNEKNKIYFFNIAEYIKIFWIGNFSTPYYYSDNYIPIEVNLYGKNYKSVFEFYENNIDSNDVYKIQFNNQYGILRYYYNNGEVFELKDIRTNYLPMSTIILEQKVTHGNIK